jgi:hypothetical protein
VHVDVSPQLRAIEDVEQQVLDGHEQDALTVLVAASLQTSAEQQLVPRLRYWDELPFAWVALEMDRSISAAKQVAWRALAAVRRGLESDILSTASGRDSRSICERLRATPGSLADTRSCQYSETSSDLEAA